MRSRGGGRKRGEVPAGPRQLRPSVNTRGAGSGAAQARGLRPRPQAAAGEPETRACPRPGEGPLRSPSRRDCAFCAHEESRAPERRQRRRRPVNIPQSALEPSPAAASSLRAERLISEAPGNSEPRGCEDETPCVLLWFALVFQGHF